MIPMPNNLILVICVGIVASIVIFIIYGLIRGFENVFKEFENPECVFEYCDLKELEKEVKDHTKEK